VYIDVLHCGCGSVSCTAGTLVSGCIYRHVNGKLEYIRLIFMCMLIHQMMVEGILIVRRSSEFGCLAWLFKFFHVQVVDMLWS